MNATLNAIHPTAFAPIARSRAPRVPVAPPRPARRERDFGIGYGRSSGYASAHRYTSEWAPPCFRFV